jgi:hypothetical protein
MFFLLTTAAGSALWVVKLEEQKTLVAAGAEAAAVGDGAQEEALPAYTDDPV